MSGLNNYTDVTCITCSTVHLRLRTNDYYLHDLINSLALIISDTLIIIGTTATAVIVIIISLSWIIVCIWIYKRRKLLRTQKYAIDNVLR